MAPFFMNEEYVFKLEAKKVALAILSLALAFLLVIISVFSINSTSAAESENYLMEEVGEEKEEGMEEMEEVMASDEASIVLAEETEYVLPYPGILPDHPLYWLKMIRDRIWLTLTRDPVQKIERLILYADKRLGAGKALIDGNKKSLGVTTLSKSEKYLEKALDEMNKSQQEQARERLELSVQEHNRVLNTLEKKISDDNKKTWQESLNTNEKARERLGQNK